MTRILFLLTSLLLFASGCGDRTVIESDPVPYDSSVPSAVTLLSPQDNYYSTNRKPVFSWGSIATYSYRLLIATNSNFNHMVYDESISSATSASWNPPVDLSVAQDLYWRVIGTNSSSSNCSPVQRIVPPPGLRSILITEWAAPGSGHDFIELKNFGEEILTVTSSLKIIYNGNTVSITHYGTGTNVSAYTALGGGVSIAPGEVFIVVDSDITYLNVSNMQTDGWDLPDDCKIFLSTETTLIGTGDRLDDTRACLTNSDGDVAWSITPDPTLFGSSVGISTYSVLNANFIFQNSQTSDVLWWENSSAGTAADQFRTPGNWP